MSVFIIAEAGVNHNGSLDLALRLVDAAADAGADAIKFQTFKAEEVISAFAPKCDYQISDAAPAESQLEMVRQLELRRDDHYPIVARCKERGIIFLSTGFDSESVRFLARDLDVALMKVPSGEVDNAPFLLEISAFRKPMILSTGMSTLGEVKSALGVLAFGLLQKQDEPSPEAFREAFSSAEGQAALKEKLTLLHCTTEYPAPFAEVNLRAMQTMAAVFGVPVGLSDHSTGAAVPVAAAALGAAVIEKHFTLDRSLPGPDHKASLEPGELAAMVAGIRAAEMALGARAKLPTPAEWRNRPIVRRSLVAARPSPPGSRSATPI